MATPISDVSAHSKLPMPKQFGRRLLILGLSLLAAAASGARGDEPRQPPDKPDQPRPPRRQPPPKTDRIQIGIYQPSERHPAVLVHRPRPQGDAPFKRLMPGGAVFSNDTLINLPGCTTQIKTKTDVALTMRGNLPDFSIDPLMDSLLEVAIILHAPADGIDLDLTLNRGRIYLANLKEKKDAVVRLRFLEQVWDVTLKEGAEVGVDLIKKYTADIDYLEEEPRSDVALCVLQGKVQILVNAFQTHKMEAPPGLALLQWDSVNEAPPIALPIPGEMPLIWSQASPSVVLNKHLQRMKVAFNKAKIEEGEKLKPFIVYYEGQLERTKKVLPVLGELSDLLSDSKLVGVVLEEHRVSKRPEQRQLAIFALGALGELDKLLATLTDEDPEHVVERDNAIFALRRYLSHDLEASRLLFHDEGKKKTGLLVKKYGEKDGEKVFTLLHDFDQKDLTAETFGLLAHFLSSDKLAVRQMAFWHLSRLSVSMNVTVPKKASDYNPAAPREIREAAAGEWQKLVEDGKLPPRKP